MTWVTLGFSVVAVQEQPPRALGDVAPDQRDAEAHRGGEPERDPSADVTREQLLVEQHERGERADPIGRRCRTWIVSSVTGR
jgi:hypothetical protein